MEIEGTKFGSITIDRKTYQHDVVIRLSGEVITGERMALHYIEAASRKKMAAFAMEKLNKNRTSIVSQQGDVRHSGQKE